MALRFFMETGNLFQALVRYDEDNFPACPRWSGAGRFFLARERVVGPSNFHSELANCFQAATDVMRAVKEATEGMLSLHRNDVRSAYPYFGKPMIARTPALHAV